jgi:hypothetical protein
MRIFVEDKCESSGWAARAALVERWTQRGTNCACSGMAAIEHCQAQDKGFGGVGNTLAMGKVIFFIIVIICLDWNFLFQKWKFL